MPIFTHRFREDLCAIDWFGEPFALARFADGERACIESTDYVPYGVGMGGASETWRGDGPAPWRAMLIASLEADVAGYFVGISPTCCQGKHSGWQHGRVRAPAHRRVAATLFSYGNYDYALSIAHGLRLRERSVLVSGVGGDHTVPLNAINEEWDLDGLLSELMEVRDRPILVAAGPMACVIVHQYWLRQDPEHRQIIVDVGSLFDEELHGHGTRMHQQKVDPRAMRSHMCELHGPRRCPSPACKAHEKGDVPWSRRKVLRRAGFRHPMKPTPS